MYHQLSIAIVPLLLLYRQITHGYAWTSEISWINWVTILIFTITLIQLSKKNKFLVFVVSTSSWILSSATSTYFIAIPLILLLYTFNKSKWVYILYPLISIFNPLASLVAAIIHTTISKGKMVYTIALACTGFLITINVLTIPMDIPAIYYIIGILALTIMLLTNIQKFMFASLTLVIGIISMNSVIVFSSLLYTIAWYLKHLTNQKWSMTELKQISMAAIVTMILFSTIITADNIIQSEPHENTLTALKSVNDKIIILEKQELAARISGSHYVLATDLVIPRTERVQQLRQDGFLEDDMYTVPYPKIIIETMKLNNVTHILYEKGTYEKGIGSALHSEVFVQTYENNEMEVYTYGN